MTVQFANFGQAQLRAHEAHVLADEVEEHAEQEAADHRAGGALEAAEHRCGKGIDQDRLHHRRLQELRRLGHQAGNRAEHGGEAPPDREHPVTLVGGRVRERIHQRNRAGPFGDRVG